MSSNEYVLEGIQDIDLLRQRLQAAEEARDHAEAVVETVREPLVVLDADLRVQRAMPAFYETFLVTREQTEGRLLYEFGNGQWNRPRLRELLGSALFRDAPFQDYEIEHDFPHIGRRTMRLNARRIRPQNVDSRRLLLAIEDVTERREIAEIRFQRLFESAKDGILVAELEMEIVLDVNPYLLGLTGFAREDVVGKRFEEAGPFLENTGWSGLISAVRRQEMVRDNDIPLRNARGGQISVEVIATHYKLGKQPVVQFNFRDITARKQDEERLRQQATLLEEQQEFLKRSAEQKNVLVREIHHRVKNNLQVIVSLLSLQSRYTDDPRLLAAFEDTESRVRAIANIHETLYASEDLTEVEFAAYLNQLVNELMALHVTEPSRVVLELHAQETVLEIEQAVPLGLMANELVLNSLKHGLKARGGKLKVTLAYFRDNDPQASAQAQNNGWVRLQVADNGPGLPRKPDLANVQSMGFRLLNLLSRQLHANVEFGEGPGAVVTVTFPAT